MAKSWIKQMPFMLPSHLDAISVQESFAVWADYLEERGAPDYVFEGMRSLFLERVLLSQCEAIDGWVEGESNGVSHFCRRGENNSYCGKPVGDRVVFRTSRVGPLRRCRHCLKHTAGHDIQDLSPEIGSPRTAWQLAGRDEESAQ